ncbi:MAG: alpha/beta hydrolase [Xanthobacteraceae bacterium]|nr:alpha/beta hydrolase [Xanthobacteraceae bacterium]
MHDRNGTQVFGTQVFGTQVFGTQVFVSAPDGLQLHVRCYGARGRRRPPVVCLPGLARTTEDFDTLATALANAADRPRQVLAMDYRGRGESGHDPNPDNYNLGTEIADLLAVLTALEVEPAVFIGTSRGGILAMILATVRPAAIAGVVLNDIGPVIETKGLVRIKSYLGRLPQPKSLEEGAEILRHLFSAQFSMLEADGWIQFAKRTFKEQNGALVPRYDPKLAHVLEGVDMARALPPLWKEFDALASVPVMVIRGANSDILSELTVAEMRARRADLDVLAVPEQGHAPFLTEPDVIARIDEFTTRCG